MPRQPRVSVAARHGPGPALLDEWYPITLVITNREEAAVSVIVDAEVKASTDAKGMLVRACWSRVPQVLTLSPSACAAANPRRAADIKGYLARETSDLPAGKPAIRDVALPHPVAAGTDESLVFYLRSPRSAGDRVVAFTVRPPSHPPQAPQFALMRSAGRASARFGTSRSGQQRRAPAPRNRR